MKAKKQYVYITLNEEEYGVEEVVDGICPRNSTGPYDSFSEAKAALIAHLMHRAQAFKLAAKDARSIKLKNL